MARYQDQVFDEYGRPVPGAYVWVFDSGVYPTSGDPGALSTLTDDQGLPLTNPVETDTYGLFYFNAIDGLYNLEIRYSGELRYAEQVLVGVAIGAVLDGDRVDITVTQAGAVWTINPNAVTNAKIANSAVTSGKIADGAVGTYQLADNNVTSTKLAPDSVTSVKISNGAVTTDKIADSAVTNAKIVDGAVGTPEIADGAVTTAKIQNDSVDFAKLQNIVTNSIIGRNTAGTGNAEELLPGHVAAMLPVFTSSLNGLAPASGGGTVNYLRADGTWGNPFSAGGGSFVASFNTRTGNVTLLSADVTDALGYTPANDDIVSLAAPGLAPQLPGGNSQYLCADGTWAIPATDVGSVAWGAIVGTLSNQTDLQAELDGLQLEIDGKVALAGGSLAKMTGNLTLLGTLIVGRDVADTVEYGRVTFGVNGAYLRGSKINFQNIAGAQLATVQADGNLLLGTDSAYGAAWNGSLQVPTKNAVYDQFTAVDASLATKADASALAAKANLAGGNTFTGAQNFDNIAATNTVTIKASAGQNAQLYLRDEANLAQGVLYWDRAADRVRLVRYAADGVASEGVFALEADQATLFYGLSVGKTGDWGVVSTGAADFLTPGTGTTGGLRIRGSVAAGDAIIQITDATASSQWGYWNHLADGSATWNGAAGLKSNGVSVATVNPRIQTAAANSVTPTFADDLVIRTGATAAITLNNPTGTAVNGAGIVVRLKDNGTARAISYGSQYRAIGVALPTATVANKWVYLGMIYNQADVRWDVVSVAQEA